MDITEVRPSEKTTGIIRVLQTDGSTNADNDPQLDLPVVQNLYAAMVRTRIVEAGIAKLKDSGEIPFHSISIGYEAATVGSAMAMAETDWMFPAHRALGAFLFRGVPVVSYLNHILGNQKGATNGRSMPGFFTGKEHRIASVSSPTSGHMTQAVGYAWAAEMQDKPIGVLAFLSEKTVDAAEFHTALNFAGVFQANVVFACHSTGIRETDIAENCHAYGLPSVACDGTDALAVYDTIHGALERAQANEGPTLVELRRTGGDPVLRLRQHLSHLKGWSESDEQGLRMRAKAEFDEALTAALAHGKPEFATAFEGVFEDLPAHLTAQKKQAERLQ